MFSTVLVRFVCQITFGMSVAMLLTSPRQVTSGYFRVHLWVLLGLNTFAALLAITLRNVQGDSYLLVLAVTSAAALSYVGSVCWLYERPRWGRGALALLAANGMLGCGALANLASSVQPWVRLVDDLTAGLLLGSTLAAMFLGHWYLNTPSMQLGPLQRLVALILVAVGLRASLCGIGFGMQLASASSPAGSFWAVLSLRWLSGLVGTGVLCLMTWYTLKIPNTQSATGILYVAVICVFLGELTSQFLGLAAGYPL